MLIAEGCVAPCGDNWMPNQPTIFDSPCGLSPFNFNCLLQSTLVFCLVLCLAAADLLCGGTYCHHTSGCLVPTSYSFALSDNQNCVALNGHMGMCVTNTWLK